LSLKGCTGRDYFIIAEGKKEQGLEGWNS